jgi:hypothetical protein
MLTVSAGIWIPKEALESTVYGVDHPTPFSTEVQNEYSYIPFLFCLFVTIRRLPLLRKNVLMKSGLSHEVWAIS